MYFQFWKLSRKQRNLFLSLRVCILTWTSLTYHQKQRKLEKTTKLKQHHNFAIIYNYTIEVKHQECVIIESFDSSLRRNKTKTLIEKNCIHMLRVYLSKKKCNLINYILTSIIQLWDWHNYCTLLFLKI